MKRFFFILGLFCLSHLLAAETQFSPRYEALRENKENATESDRLARLFALRWEQMMLENPERATEVGYPGQNDRWSDVSFDEIQKQKSGPVEAQKVLQSIKRGKLSASEQLNYDLFKFDLEREISGQKFPSELMPINQMGGVQQEVASILAESPAATVKDFENMIARLNGVPTLVDQTIDLLRRGAEQGITPPRITLRDVPDQIKNQTVDDSRKNPLMRPFNSFPKEISSADQTRLQEAAWKAVSEKAIPAFKKLHLFFVGEYLPKTRETIGLSALPNGQAWYSHNAYQATTTELAPRQIHGIGQREVKRIRGEMEAVIRETGFKGSFAEFCNFLRTDRQFYYTNANDLLEGYRDITRRVDQQLPKLFGHLPKTPYHVEAVPSYAEKSQTTAYYQPGSPRTGRPGIYFANTYALNTRPKWEMEALSLHESVPGHHLQIAIAQEMEGQPEFRRHGEYTAFVEGWGLYSESLGQEMGFYQDPYSKFGQLTYEMWRAVRLVVDTGMHSMGWSREKAIDFFKENTSKSEHDIVVEIDRYIVWPGQALAYKIGELKIKELRATAAQALREKFDLRAFHDQVLGNGALPLDVLDTRVRDWVSSQRR